MRVLGLAALGFSTTGLAAPLPIVGGPTSNTASVGFRFPYQLLAPGRPINAAGTAIGIATFFTGPEADLGPRAVRFDRVGTNTTLSPIGVIDNVSFAYAASINASGQVVGNGATVIGNQFGGPRAIRWNAAGVATALDQFGSDADGNAISKAYDLNDAGTAVGFSEKYDLAHIYRGSFAVRWNAGGSAATQLGGLSRLEDGNSSDSALAINRTGTIVGYAQRFDAPGVDLGYRPVRWNANTTAAVELGNLGLNADGVTDGQAVAINNAGTAIGYVDRYDAGVYQGRRSVRWSAAGVPQELSAVSLPVAGEAAATSANALNAAGAVAGSSVITTATGEYRGTRAVVWPANSGTPLTLNTLGTDPTGLTESEATGINASGYMIGDANQYDASGNFVTNRAILWRPNGTALTLDSLIVAGSPWQLTQGNGISDTGWVTGYGTYRLSPTFTYERLFSILVPEAGTYGRGDADFDTDVDFDDLLLLARQYGKLSNGSLNAADFDLDGDTDFDDLLTLARNFGTPSARGLASLTSDAFAADFALAQSIVPEPTIAVLGIAGTVARRRRV